MFSILLIAPALCSPVRECRLVNGTVVCSQVSYPEPTVSCNLGASCICDRELNIRCANGLICGYTRAQYYDESGFLRGPDCSMVGGD
ncbi:hypothetical protein EDD86DRAFT_204514 [Gorgonomyces haynaldii]|nr:hypothetical protein EDD86DRAFT_204514 [Gorgonomyces haynaldii]